MPKTEQQVALVPVDDEPVGGLATVIERLAANPQVDVAKLEKIIELQERILKHQAKAAFDAAFADMQGEIPVISEKGQIIVNGQLRSKYATNEDIQEAVKPILQKHGFALRFRHEWYDGKLKVVGILSHRTGHSEQDEFLTGADASGQKNDIQAIGSARSYGQRYCTTALLNIATRNQPDDDGQKAGRKEAPPDGYQQWADDMAAVADEGMDRFREAWAKSKPQFQLYAAKHDKDAMAKVRKRAESVTAKAGKS